MFDSNENDAQAGEARRPLDFSDLDLLDGGVCSSLEESLSKWPELQKRYEDGRFGRFNNRLTLSLVTDACGLINVVDRKVCGKPSGMWHLVEQGLISCWAPIQLDEDLKGKFEKLAARRGVDVTHVEAVWHEAVAPHVRIAYGQVPPEVADYLEELRQRDPEDVAYAALALIVGADAVLSLDRDLSETAPVHVFEFGDVLRVHHRLRRGRIATTIQFRMETASTLVLGGTGLMLWHSAVSLVSLLKRVPRSVWVAAGAAALVAMIFPKSRAWMLNQFKNIGEMSKSACGFIFDHLQEIVTVYASWQELLRAAASEADEICSLYPRIGLGASTNAQPSLGISPLFPTPTILGFHVTQAVGTVMEVLRREGAPLSFRQAFAKAFAFIQSCDVDALRRAVWRSIIRRSDVVRGDGRMLSYRNPPARKPWRRAAALRRKLKVRR